MTGNDIENIIYHIANYFCVFRKKNLKKKDSYKSIVVSLPKGECFSVVVTFIVTLLYHTDLYKSFQATSETM